MTREWKLGTVARVLHGPRQTPEMCIRSLSNDGWCADDGFVPDEVVWKVTPCVVIDPTHPEHVEDHFAGLRTHLESVLRVSVEDRQWQRILGRLADDLIATTQPERPEEPTGLGAVVEDEDGQTWVRVEPADAESTPWVASRSGRGRDEQPAWYDDISAVRVLSEGVTP